MNSLFHHWRKAASFSALAIKKRAKFIAQDIKSDWDAGYLPKATYPLASVWIWYWIWKINHYIKGLLRDLIECEKCKTSEGSEKIIPKNVINDIAVPQCLKKVEVEIFDHNNGKTHLIALDPNWVIIRENEKDHQYSINCCENRVIKYEINKKSE